MLRVPLVGLLMLLVGAFGASAADESSINCIGTWNNCSVSNDGRWGCRVEKARRPFQSTTCSMTNVCVYGNVVELYSDNTLTGAFDGLMIPTSSFARMDVAGDPANVRLVVKPSSQLPADEGVFNSSFTAVLINSIQTKNIGHIYGDEIWPAFQMLYRYNFDFDSNSLQLVLMDYLRHAIEHKKQPVHAIFSDLPTQYLRTEGTELPRRCFSSLYAGSNAFSYSESAPDPHVLDAFRHFLLKRSAKLWNTHTTTALLSNHDFRPKADRADPAILVLEKDTVHAQHPTLVLNYEALTDALRSKFPTHKIIKVVWHGKSQQEQIAIAQDSDIFFSFPGSDVMNAIFLPAGSTLVTPCRAQDAKWVFGDESNGRAPNKLLVEYGNEMRIWFNAMPHLRSVQVCGANTVIFDKSKYMTPATFNITNVLSVMEVAIQEWKGRRDSRNDEL